MYDERKRTVFSRLRKGDKVVKLLSDFEISKQQVPNIPKNRQNIMRFVHDFETSFTEIAEIGKDY